MHPQFLSSDEAFDSLFPISIRGLSAMHWTPLKVARTAAQFLGPGSADRVIDIGAGAGKFCIAGGCFSPASFTGIEQRKAFVQVGNKIISRLGMQQQVRLLHGNFTGVQLSSYTGIYFYNSFHEYIASEGIDNKTVSSEELHERYTQAFHTMLGLRPAGTRLATYWLTVSEVPGSYRLQSEHYEGNLKLWVRV